MKKLLVLALSVVMVLAFAAVSMAAVTVSGEVNFKLTIAPDALVADAGQGDAKVAFTAALNDEVSAFVALKHSGVDETWAKFTEGFGTVKVGYFGWNIKDKLDILDGGKELKSQATINAEFAVAEGMTLSATVIRPDDTMDMGFKFTYSTDAFGASLGYISLDDSRNTYTDKEAPMAVNVWYNLTPAVVYLTYTTADDANTNAVLGASYDSDSIYARAEFEVVAPDGVDASNAFRVGYKLGNGAKLELNSKSVRGADAETSVKLNVAF